MAIAQKMGSMQQLKEDFAAVRSVADLLRLRGSSDPQRVAALRKVAGAWKPLTWAELAGLAEEAAWGLIALGVKPADKVAIIGNTRVEWTVTDMGIAHAAAVSVPIYHSSIPEDVRYILQNCAAAVAVVEDGKQLAKLREIRAQVPALRIVVLIEGEGDGESVLSFAQLVARGKEYKSRVPGELQKRLEQQRRDELSTILYTSGTTGAPKGVMTTNDQLIFAAEVVVGTGLLPREASHLLWLPFAHSFAQIVKAAWLGCGLKMIYAESVDKLVDNASETGPTVLSAVPRVYEKAFNNVIANGMAQKGVAGSLFRMAMREFELYAKAKEKGQTYSSLPFSLAKRLVFPKIRDKLSKRFGGQITTFVSGGAPLARKIAYFFDLLGFNMLEGYGLTETIAVTSVNLPGQNKLGTVGRPFPGVEVKIAEDGEILERGRHIMRGYFGMPEATAEVIDKQGWFHTGDIGEIDADGYLRITDRKKDLIKTSGGKYIAPQAIEGALKTMTDLISQVVVIGDRRKYVSVLITVVEDVAKKTAAEGGEPAGSYRDASQSKAVRKKVEEAIERLNSTLPSYETIKRFTILERDFSLETGELTPTLKVKRKTATQHYKSQIDAMYDGEVLD
ncbi:MAG TPA: long-chain fatty acid--CoA ligase [Myxococcales bacterium]|nr:long-chain fatty acid--CoA ligase [Myxococcales bacterium]